MIEPLGKIPKIGRIVNQVTVRSQNFAIAGQARIIVNN